MKKALQQQLEDFKKGLIIPTADEIKKMFADVAKYDDTELKSLFGEVKAAAIKQGEELQKLSEQRKNADVKGAIESALMAKKDILDKIANEKTLTKKEIIQLKAINASSFTNNVSNFSDPEIGRMAQGTPFALEMLQNSITVPKGNQGSIDYWYESTATNNGGAVTENAHSTESTFAWTRGSLGWRKVQAWTKVSIHQLNDMAFLNSAVNDLLNTDFALALQNELINGTGLTTHVNGLLSYATEFDTTHADVAGVVPTPDLVDVINGVQLQIERASKNLFRATRAFCKRVLLWGLQIAKDDIGRRLYENIAMSGTAPVINGVTLMTNELAGENSLVVGDMTKAKLYNWDGIQMEIMQIGDDQLDQLVTIAIYARLNLLVKPTDVQAIVKVSDYADAISKLTKVGA